MPCCIKLLACMHFFVFMYFMADVFIFSFNILWIFASDMPYCIADILYRCNREYIGIKITSALALFKCRNSGSEVLIFCLFLHVVYN